MTGSSSVESQPRRQLNTLFLWRSASGAIAAHIAYPNFFLLPGALSFAATALLLLVRRARRK
jgi:hypothetical protein